MNDKEIELYYEMYPFLPKRKLSKEEFKERCYNCGAYLEGFFCVICHTWNGAYRKMLTK